MRVSALLSAVLCAGIAYARRNPHIYKAIPGGTGLKSCDKSSVIQTIWAQIDPVPDEESTYNLLLSFTNSETITHGTGTMYVLEPGTKWQDQFVFDLCAGFVEGGQCPLPPGIYHGNITLPTKGRPLDQIQLNIQIFSDTQIACLRGFAEHKKKSQVVIDDGLVLNNERWDL